MAGSCGASCAAVANDNQQAVPVASRSCCFSAPLQYSPARLLTRPGKSAETAGEQGQRRWKHSAAAIPGYCLSTEHASRQGAALVSCCPHAALFQYHSASSTALVLCCPRAALFHNHSPSSSIALARSPYSSPMGPTISSCACRLPLRMSRAARAIKSQLQVRLSAGGGHRMNSEQAKPASACCSGELAPVSMMERAALSVALQCSGHVVHRLRPCWTPVPTPAYPF